MEQINVIKVWHLDILQLILMPHYVLKMTCMSVHDSRFTERKQPTFFTFFSTFTVNTHFHLPYYQHQENGGYSIQEAPDYGTSSLSKTLWVQFPSVESPHVGSMCLQRRAVVVFTVCSPLLSFFCWDELQAATSSLLNELLDGHFQVITFIRYCTHARTQLTMRF